MVGLPAAGKTTRARVLAATEHALRLTPDAWMIPLFGESTAGDRRDVLEGRLISTALQALAVGTPVVLDFGFWGRDERWSLHAIAADLGVPCRTVFLDVDPETQARWMAERYARTPHLTFWMSPEELIRWRAQFEPPDAAELAGGPVPAAPRGWDTWWDWAADRWPSLDDEPRPDREQGPPPG